MVELVRSVCNELPVVQLVVGSSATSPLMVAAGWFWCDELPYGTAGWFWCDESPYGAAGWFCAMSCLMGQRSTLRNVVPH